MRTPRSRTGENVLIAQTATGRAYVSYSGERGTCPLCHGEVRGAKGQIVSPYWSHLSTADCDHWSEGETDWHAQWKTAAPMDRREVIRGPHVADVIAGDGVVCEIQHSSISLTDVEERERFYGDMRWIFDARDKRFEWEPPPTPRESRRNWDEPLRWRIHRRDRWPTIGRCRKRVMLDFGDQVMSCEWINATGSAASGLLYPPSTIRRWIAGPGYPQGWSVPAEMNANTQIADQRYSSLDAEELAMEWIKPLGGRP